MDITSPKRKRVNRSHYSLARASGLYLRQASVVGRIKDARVAGTAKTQCLPSMPENISQTLRCVRRSGNRRVFSVRPTGNRNLETRKRVSPLLALAIDSLPRCACIVILHGSSKQIEQRKQKDPDDIHKVPVQRHVFDQPRFGSSQRHRQHDDKRRQSKEHMNRMESR